MEPKWAERKRNEELIAFIKNKNDAGTMPTTHSIYSTMNMAKATSCKYLAMLRIENKIGYVLAGPTQLWYIAKDDEGNTLIPKIVFEKKE